jgi:hypothetical protein
MSCKGSSDPERKTNTDVAEHRWVLSETIQEPVQPGLPIPDEASARQRCLHKGVNAPDLATVKDFLRFHAASGCGKIDEEKQLTADSLNAFAE